MTVGQAADQLIQIVQQRREEGAELGESHLICSTITKTYRFSVLEFSFTGNITSLRTSNIWCNERT